MQKVLERYLESVRQPNQAVNPLFTFLGISVIKIDKDHATLSLTAKPELMQGAGQLAGGILATLLDETMAHAVLGGNNSHQVTTTVDINVTYYRPANKGDELTCTAHVTKRGSRVVFTEATIRNSSLEIAAATATFLIIDSKQ